MSDIEIQFPVFRCMCTKSEVFCLGERQQAEFPGLTRGLVAVLLYYDGQKSMINSLRTLLQSREGRMWTMELTPDLSNMVNQYTDQLLQKDRLINTILGNYNLIKIRFSIANTFPALRSYETKVKSRETLANQVTAYTLAQHCHLA